MFLLLNVKKQSYYKWIKNGSRLFNKWNESLASAIKDLNKSNPYYGYITIADKLKTTKNKANKNTVYRYMKAMDIKGLTRKRVAYKYPVKAGYGKLPNLLLENGIRNFTSIKRNTKWSVDITYLEKRITHSICSLSKICLIKELLLTQFQINTQ